MIVKINKEVIDVHDEMVYCSIHKRWHQCDDEMNCCASELEGIIIAQEKWQLSWKKLFKKD